MHFEAFKGKTWKQSMEEQQMSNSFSGWTDISYDFSYVGIVEKAILVFTIKTMCR